MGMKTTIRLSILLFLLLITVSLFSQSKEGSAIISGKILFEEDSIYPLKPYSFIFIKEWPISFQRFEQAIIDTTDYSFKFTMALEQLTNGNVIVGFLPDTDSTSWEQNRGRIADALRDGPFINEYVSRIVFPGLRIVIEPGDSLHILINYDILDQYGRAMVNFSGTGGTNNNLQRSKYPYFVSSKNFKVPLEVGLGNEDLLMKKELQNLNKAKDSISQAYYNLLWTDYTFSNFGAKHALIRASLYPPEFSKEEKRNLAREHYAFLDSLSLRSEYLNSRAFRSFLSFYLEYLNRIITGDDVPFGFDEKSYWLANAVFEKEVLKAFLYERLEFQMEVPLFYQNQIFQYENFINRFPDTPESFRLTEIYNNHISVSNGQQAPDLELIDSLGRTTSLSRLKGKVVILSTSYALHGPLSNEKEKRQLDFLRSIYGDNKLVLITFNAWYQQGKEFLFPEADYYVKGYPYDQSLKPYQFQRSQQYSFIIGKNGTIEKCTSNLEFTDELIAQLMSEKYSFLTRLGYAAKNHITGIVIILSFLLSIALVLLLVSRIKRNRQALVKKQLDSELKAIRSQLNPHFLFNSLNSIQNFINKSDTKTANMHLSKFSSLMRRVIELSEKEGTTLQEELDFNKTYIELEQLRYGFTCTFDIDEAIDLHNTEIPSMIIQPFVENAIVHCMADLGEKGELRISLKEAGSNKIEVVITDNGKGFLEDTKKGFGLKSSRERIDLLNSQHKDKIELHIQSSIDTKTLLGTSVKLIIPKKY